MVSVITTVMPAEVPAEVHADVPAGMPAETAAVKSPVIAIDGPSASGKGTVAARVADALGFHLVRPAGRTHLEVKVLYSPGKGKS